MEMIFKSPARNPPWLNRRTPSSSDSDQYRLQHWSFFSSPFSRKVCLSRDVNLLIFESLERLLPNIINISVDIVNIDIDLVVDI